MRIGGASANSRTRSGRGSLEANQNGCSAVRQSRPAPPLEALAPHTSAETRAPGAAAGTVRRPVVVYSFVVFAEQYRAQRPRERAERAEQGEHGDAAEQDGPPADVIGDGTGEERPEREARHERAAARAPRGPARRRTTPAISASTGSPMSVANEASVASAPSRKVNATGVRAESLHHAGIRTIAAHRAAGKLNTRSALRCANCSSTSRGSASPCTVRCQPRALPSVTVSAPA